MFWVLLCDLPVERLRICRRFIGVLSLRLGKAHFLSVDYLATVWAGNIVSEMLLIVICCYYYWSNVVVAV